MPANVETMMYTGEVPWHRQGVRLANPATAAEAISAAGLNWEVQKQPIYTGPDRSVRIRDRFVMCRTDRLAGEDGGQLGIVGGDYEPLQNREAFGFLDPVVGEGGAVYHTAGALRGGRQIWMLAKLPGEIRVVGDDVTEKFLLLSNSHDGTSAVRIGFTPIRVVCQNTLNLAHRNLQGLTVRHHADVAARVREAHRLLGIVNTEYDRAGQVMQNMARIGMTGTRLSSYFNEVMPLPAEEKDRAKILDRHRRLGELFETGDGNALPGARGTLWAAYNAITQWVDRESYTSRNREPLRAIWFGEPARLKHRAFEVAERLTAIEVN